MWNMSVILKASLYRKSVISRVNCIDLRSYVTAINIHRSSCCPDNAGLIVFGAWRPLRLGDGTRTGLYFKIMIATFMEIHYSFETLVRVLLTSLLTALGPEMGSLKRIVLARKLFPAYLIRTVFCEGRVP